jgi:hypothetical protein
MQGFEALQIQPGGANPVLTQEQARFNTLVSDVALWRAALAQWKERIERFDQAVEPVRRELHAAWREWVFALDEASLQPGLARAEREELSELLREAAAALLSVEDEDPGIASVLARHEPGQIRGAAASDGAADGAAQASSHAAVPQDTAETWQELADAAAAEREKRAASRRAASVRKRRSQAAQEVSQSLRDVYRKLASVLHPDREPDAEQRERKTVLMQQANQAYAEGNLLALLELQVEAEQVATPHPGNLDQRRLQHYITVLQEQLAQLQAETRRLESEFRAAAGIAPGSGLQPRKADRLITSEAQRLRGELLLLRRQTRLLLDVEATKSWLREQRKA